VARPSKRDELLTAGAAHVRRAGAAGLTLDAVATAAEVSKGGLLYHFPTKQALVAALVEDVLDRFETDVDARAAADPRPRAWAHAYVDATFDVSSSQPDVASALLTGADADAGLLERCAARFDAWGRRLAEDGLEPVTAALVRFACDGWWTYAAIATAGGQGRDLELRDRLHELIAEEAAA
jgi:AcrR family transcriptional regulator